MRQPEKHPCAQNEAQNESNAPPPHPVLQFRRTHAYPGFRRPDTVAVFVVLRLRRRPKQRRARRVLGVVSQNRPLANFFG